jgi:hypothetical protein
MPAMNVGFSRTGNTGRPRVVNLAGRGARFEAFLSASSAEAPV